MPKGQRFREVQDLIIKFSRGDFGNKHLSSQTSGDIVDAFLANLAMLGEELKESTVSKEYFENIFNSTPDIIIILNAKGEIITANNAFQKNIIEQKEIPKKYGHFLNYFHNPETKKIAYYLRLAKQGQNPEMIVLPKSRKKKILSGNVSFFKDHGRQLQYILVLRDVTELKQYELQLAVSERKYKEIFNASGDGIVTFSEEGQVNEMNSTLKNIIGTDRATINNLHINQIIHPVDLEINNLMKEITTNGKVENIEIKIAGSKNKKADGLFSCVTLYRDDSIKNFQGTIKNISGYKKTNSLLMRSIDKVQENERKRIAGDLHDSLGQQLVGIKMMMNSFISVTKENKDRKYLQEINNNITATVEELRSICFDLMPGTLESFGLKAALEELCIKTRRTNTKCKIKLKIPIGFPRVTKELEVAVYRIIQELLNNALKHAACKQIEFKLYISADNQLVVYFADDGKGFNRKGLSAKKGMGLGNITTRVHAFNGTVNMKSKPGAGTEYDIIIPLQT